MNIMSVVLLVFSICFLSLGIIFMMFGNPTENRRKELFPIVAIGIFAIGVFALIVSIVLYCIKG